MAPATVIFKAERSGSLDMAKHKSRRGFLPVRVAAVVSLGALATTGISENVLLTNSDQELYLVSGDLIVSMRDHTPDQGPITVGVAHGDYSATEIDEWFESNAAVTKDMIAREKSRRKCRAIGAFPGTEATEVLNDGKPIRVKLGFAISEGSNLNLWGRNDDDGTLTSGTDIVITGTVFCRMI